jgi:hypothetical protein
MRFASSKLLRVAYASVAVTVLAQAADIAMPNIKPGLWQVTTNPQMSGQLPIPDDQLAKMPPEQRARIEAAVQASANKPRVYRECMTPEKIARGFEIDRHGEDSSCQRKVITSSSSELKLHDECTKPEGKSVTDVHFKVKGGEQMNGQITAVITSGTKTMTVNSTVQGKWLGASCGTVTDAELQK